MSRLVKNIGSGLFWIWVLTIVECFDPLIWANMLHKYALPCFDTDVDMK